MLRELQRGLPARSPGGAAGARAPEEGARTPRGSRQAQEPCREALALLSAENSLGHQRSPVPAAPKAPGRTEWRQDDPKAAFQAALSPKILQKSSSQLFLSLVGVFFVFFFPSLSQVFKPLWTFPCHSTSLGKWEGRKPYRGFQK